jgi:hypothetical protein
MKNVLMPLMDKHLLRKRTIVDTIIDQLKNISQIEHSRHRSPINFLINWYPSCSDCLFRIHVNQTILKRSLLTHSDDGKNEYHGGFLVKGSSVRAPFSHVILRDGFVFCL